MTYVREQKSAELAVHMRSLKKMAGWFDPLSDRLWQEVEALQALVAGLKTGYEAYERVNAELKADVEALRSAALKVIEMNRQHAKDQYGDSDKAESWSCITVLRAAMCKGSSHDY